jgi:hypothetical protein
MLHKMLEISWVAVELFAFQGPWSVLLVKDGNPEDCVEIVASTNQNIRTWYCCTPCYNVIGCTVNLEIFVAMLQALEVKTLETHCNKNTALPATFLC